METTNAANSQVPVANVLERRLDLSVAVDEIEKDVTQRLNHLGKNMKMPGFRPGKVPASIVRQQYGEQARSEALREALARLFSEAVASQQLRIAGAPRIESKETSLATHIEFSAVFEVYPEVVLKDLRDVEIHRPVLDVGPAEIDGTIEILRQQRVRYEPVDRPAAVADRVTIDFLGKKDGEIFAGGQGTDYRFVLGDGKMLADFEGAVVGSRPGESKSFEMTFPDEYFSKELAGQTVTFDVSVKEVGEPSLPKIDADFAKALGIADGDLAKMREEIEANLRREVKKRIQGKLTAQVMDALLKTHPIPVPNVLVESEVERMMEVARQDMEARGIKTQDLPMQSQWFVDQAIRRVSLGLIVGEIVAANDLAAQPAQVKAQVEEAAQSYEHPDEVIRWYYAQTDRLRPFEVAAVEQNVVDWVLTKVNVVEQPVLFADLMGHAS